jgi:hypothetical protein
MSKSLGDNFVWWIGKIEDNSDPLGLYRCKVRIFGWYDDGNTDESKNKIPTSDLPWAMSVLPINSSRSFETPQKHDWVLGFFFDGQSGQMPIILGVIPGYFQTDN